MVEGKVGQLGGLATPLRLAGSSIAGLRHLGSSLAPAGVVAGSYCRAAMPGSSMDIGHTGCAIQRDRSGRNGCHGQKPNVMQSPKRRRALRPIHQIGRAK
ncbi:hypothetical protein STVA_08530 [Allostella vacuolata]|nr:hypothetical protein STVA_08530 [Stella vacuolata]